MPPLVNEENGVKNKKEVLFFILIFTSLLICLVSFFWLQRYLDKRDASVSVPINTPPTTVAQSLEGTIYLTLASKEKKQVGIYTFNLTTRTLSESLVSGDRDIMTASVSGSSTLLVSANGTTSSDGRKSVGRQIYRYDTVTEKLSPLTTSSFTPKRHPIWVEKLGLLVYSAKSSKIGPDGIVPFSIYTSKDGKDTEIGLGAMPQLLPDGESVLVLRPEGLFSINLVTGEDKEVWGVSGGTARNDMPFDVSASGRYIAWSNMYEGKLLIMHVSSWVPFEGVIIKEIPTHSQWPVFSPDERSVAFTEFDSVEDRSRSRLNVYSFEMDRVESLVPLFDYFPNTTFVTDWK